MKAIEYRSIPTITLPGSKITNKYDNMFESNAGLYFIGLMAVDPDEQHYYLVKVGQSKEITKRIKQYFGYCPIIYQNNDFYFVENKIKRDCCEINCHNYISQYAYGIADGADEWYFVSRECYFLLCQLFDDPIMFDMIATGEVGY